MTIKSVREKLKEREEENSQLREEHTINTIRSERLVKVSAAKDELQETVCLQDSVIAKQSEELKRVYAQLETEN